MAQCRHVHVPGEPQEQASDHSPGPLAGAGATTAGAGTPASGQRLSHGLDTMCGFWFVDII